MALGGLTVRPKQGRLLDRLPRVAQLQHVRRSGRHQYTPTQPDDDPAREQPPRRVLERLHERGHHDQQAREDLRLAPAALVAPPRRGQKREHEADGDGAGDEALEVGVGVAHIGEEAVDRPEAVHQA